MGAILTRTNEKHTTITHYVGDNVYNALWRPMLIGKFGEENLDIVNMAWFWARLKTRTTRLGTYIGGFQAFLDQLADLLERVAET